MVRPVLLSLLILLAIVAVILIVAVVFAFGSYFVSILAEDHSQYSKIVIMGSICLSAGFTFLLWISGVSFFFSSSVLIELFICYKYLKATFPFLALDNKTIGLFALTLFNALGLLRHYRYFQRFTYLMTFSLLFVTVILVPLEIFIASSTTTDLVPSMTEEKRKTEPFLKVIIDKLSFLLPKRPHSHKSSIFIDKDL
eukprot:TRINITY_DN397_c0_g1_i1.p1 TRINITY_DN397_c0_g1~~TRINITY_DN397_c0_g1_i1.p1  ORF type:complete len:197 (+),score=50.74 TRINITY_DN397_c0_g1_i1:38-628(+)